VQQAQLFGGFSFFRGIWEALEAWFHFFICGGVVQLLSALRPGTPNVILIAAMLVFFFERLLLPGASFTVKIRAIFNDY
jgi:hypothetical protein